jgi:hypothetical protein
MNDSNYLQSPRLGDGNIKVLKAASHYATHHGLSYALGQVSMMLYYE